MKKHHIKKQVNKNFIFSFTLVMIPLFMVLLGVWLVNSSAFQGENAFYYIFFGLGGLAWVVIWVAFIILPGILAFYIFIFALIARLIYKETPERIRAYRILMTFSFSGQIFMLLIACSGIGIGSVYSLVQTAISGYMFFAIFQGMRGTYTDRIKTEFVMQEEEKIKIGAQAGEAAGTEAENKER